MSAQGDKCSLSILASGTTIGCLQAIAGAGIRICKRESRQLLRNENVTVRGRFCHRMHAG